MRATIIPTEAQEQERIFGCNLRRYVEQSGMLSKDVAAAVGVSPATFSEWMNGKKYPRIDKIEMLANLFHIQKSALIEEPVTDGLDEGVIQLLMDLSPDEVARVRDFVSGIKAARKA